MERFVLWVFAITSSVGGIVNAQAFSEEKSYVEFYREHFDPKYEYSSEPTIAIWWTILQFGEADIPREKLRDYLARHLELFPDCKHAEDVKHHLEIIKRMLDEKRPGDDAKVEQLIYDLRDLNLHQFMQPNDGIKISVRSLHRSDGDDDFLAPPPTVPNKLFSCGYDAVPLLIDHIDDKTLTRSVDYWRDFTYSHHVLTVGECCKQILDQIVPTGQVFDLSKDPEKVKEAMKRCYRILIEEKIEWEEKQKKKR